MGDIPLVVEFGVDQFTGPRRGPVRAQIHRFLRVLLFFIRAPLDIVPNMFEKQGHVLEAKVQGSGGRVFFDYVVQYKSCCCIWSKLIVYGSAVSRERSRRHMDSFLKVQFLTAVHCLIVLPDVMLT